MRIVVFINQLGIGGSEKAACCWAQKLRTRGHQLRFITLKDGPRRAELDGIDLLVVPQNPEAIWHRLREFQPDAVHVHAPGHPHQGDILGEALKMGKKPPVVQTNIFGQLNNPAEEKWVDFRLFISWTSCVQAARRSFQSLDESFFRRASVAVYPVDPDDGPEPSEIESFRSQHGVQEDEILFGRLSRPEPNKWTDLPIEAFRIAARQHHKIKLLLREPPPEVKAKLDASSDRDKFVVLPATSDRDELRRTIASLDVALHTSTVGESFGYGIAEPMNYGKSVIANSTPWLDQAQIELVRHGECGFIASTAHSIAEAISTLANDADLRMRLGSNAKSHIRKLADPAESINRLESALKAVIAGENNPHASEDLAKAHAAADYLDERQFGRSFRERVKLWPSYCWMRFQERRRKLLQP